MRLEVFIGQRLNLKRGDRRSSPGVIIAVTGIALSLAVMLIAIAVVTGFKKEIKEKVMGFDSQITIYPHEESEGNGSEIRLDDTLLSLLKSTVGEEGDITLSLSQPGVLKSDDAFSGVIVKGVSDGKEKAFIEENITEGTFPDSLNQIALSRQTADAMNLACGDKVYAHFFTGENVLSRRVSISAIYDTHFGEYDKLYAYSPIQFTQRLCKADSLSGNAVSISGLPLEKVADMAEDISVELFNAGMEGRLDTRHLYVRTVMESGALYFNWLELLDTNVVVILILMALVSGFTLISSTFIIILERVNMIGLLKALGATDSLIRRVFIYLAERLVMKGLLIGNLVALSTMYVQQIWRVVPLDPEAYYLNYVPVEINWWYILLVNAATIAISCIMLILPSHIISTISPARSIKYE